MLISDSENKDHIVAIADIYGVYIAYCKAIPYSKHAKVCVRDVNHYSVGNPALLAATLVLILYTIGSINLYDTVASAPLAFTTLSPDFCAGIAIGCPRAFAVKLTISRSINSLVSRARSSTSDGFRFFVSIGFKTDRT